MAVIGIDLGTTNSLGAVYRNGRVELIPNRFGSFLTPSVVSVTEDGTVLVGEIAKERLVTHPECTVSSFKKDMGTKRHYQLGSRQFLPEELSSFVIRSILQDAREYLGEEIEEAVISVPAYFHDRQRTATKQAGALVGICVNRIINEPSAAALASYLEKGKEQTFLIFDFGGGTLDISIVECFDTMVEIVSAAGDNRLGGDNFHELMAEQFLAEHGISRREISETEYAVLLRQAEACKRKLTPKSLFPEEAEKLGSLNPAEAAMSAVIGGKTYQSIYTNERLMEECGGILARIRRVLTQALQDSEMSSGDMDAVVMVGGSSRMPLIQSYLRHLFQNVPVFAENCDEMIARGLGLVCAVKERQEEIKDYILTDICPFTLGTDVYNASEPSHSYMSPIVERNTVLPCSRVRRFYTSRDNQTRIDIQILQGEHPYAEDNIMLGKMSIPVPKKKKGEEAVDIRFTYDLNGILITDMTVVSSGQTVSKVISQSMSDEELESRAAKLAKLKVHPKDFAENRLMMERLQSLYEEAPVYLREELLQFLAHFEYLLAHQNPRPIKKYREFLERVLADLDAADPFSERVKFEEYREENETSMKFDMKGNEKWTS